MYLCVCVYIISNIRGNLSCYIVVTSKLSFSASSGYWDVVNGGRKPQLKTLEGDNGGVGSLVTSQGCTGCVKATSCMKAYVGGYFWSTSYCIDDCDYIAHKTWPKASRL